MNNESKQSKASTQTTDEFIAQLTEYVFDKCEGDESKAADILQIIKAFRDSRTH